MELIFPLNQTSQMNKPILKDEIGHEKKYLLIMGSSHTCKTALLMQAAVSEAHNGKKVLFVAPQKLTKLPTAVHGMKEPSSLAMKNIQFLYAKNTSELQGYLSSVHQRPIHDRPKVILVDELNHYCIDPNGDSLTELATFSKLSSLIYDAATFHHNSDTENLDGCVMISWNLDDRNCNLKMTDVEELAKRVYQQVWIIHSKKKIDSSSSYDMKRENITLTFSHRNVNPNLQVIFLQDIFMKETF